MTTIPSYPHDLFTEANIIEPYEHYRTLRRLGPLVWLEAQQIYALPRYAEVRAALADPQTFCSGRGVGMNDLVNEMGKGTTLFSDGEHHNRRRAVLSRRLSPRALRPMRESIQHAADELVERLVAQGSFDAVADLAQALPLTVVPDLVGWPIDARDHLLEWAAASFDLLGPMNQRATDAMPHFQALIEFASRTIAEGNLLPDGAAAEILNEVAHGGLAREQAVPLIIDYMTPSLDTTISAIGSAILLFGRHPEQWDLLREDPKRIPNAFNEVVRMESPIRGFTRSLTAPTTVGGYQLKEGTRVLLLFASANRDEQQWDRPDQFDITRDAGPHVGFGYGIHACAGQNLARLEAQAVLRALVSRVERFELGTAVRGLNNIIYALAELPVTIRRTDGLADARKEEPQRTSS